MSTNTIIPNGMDFSMLETESGYTFLSLSFNDMKIRRMIDVKMISHLFKNDNRLVQKEVRSIVNGMIDELLIEGVKDEV